MPSLDAQRNAPRYATAGGVILDWVLNAQGEAHHRGCGGNGIYSAVGAHIWDTAVAASGCAARDYPQEYLDDLVKAGIDVSGVRRMPEVATRSSFFSYNEQGDRTEYVPEGVLPCWGHCDQSVMKEYARTTRQMRDVRESYDCDPQVEQLPEQYWQVRGFHVAPMKLQSQRAIGARLRGLGIPFTVDPSHSPLNDEFREFLSWVPVFLPSREDAARILGDLSEDAAMDRLCALGPQVVGIKLGRRGSLVCDTRSGRRWHVPAFKTEARDPTGAGDSFCGGFLVGWVETGDALQAALYATVSSSFVVQEFDARYALRFSRREAEARLAVLREQVR